MSPSHQLHQVALKVEDLDRAVAFYRDVVGLPFLQQFDGIAFLDLDGTRLMLDRGAPPSLLYLRATDVVAEVERLRGLGVAIEEEPRVIFEDRDGWFGDEPAAELLGFIRDSEGNVVGIAGRHPLD